MEHKLIAVIGNIPQVMTETFWALRIQRHVPINEVYVMTTTIGKETCQQRLLKEGRFKKRMGSEKDISVNVRVVAATNEDLDAKESTFRSDLLGRFPLSIALPALKDRREDIPLLANYFLKEFSEHEQKNFAGFTDEAMRALQAYDWPRNIRQLKYAIGNAAILTPENQLILSDVLFDQEDTGTFRGTFDERVEQFEKQIIREALAQTQGNITQAAKLLGLSRYTLTRRADKYDLKGL